MRDGKCLIFQLPALNWDLPGGRIDLGEEGETAFRREVLEETGLKKYLDLGVADYCIRYPENDFPPYCGLIRLLEITPDEEIFLSAEHIKLKWITEEEISDYDFCWKKMPEMIKKGFKVYKKLK